MRAMQTYAVVNKKGGVGKTTTTVNLAYILATSCNKRVLLVDADPQGNASRIVNAPNENGLSFLLYYGGIEYYPDIIDHTDIPGLDLFPCGKDLDELDFACMLGKRSATEYLNVLRGFLDVLEEDNEYDIVLIDCPPNLAGLGCLNGLRAADRLIIPTDVSAYSATGMADLIKQIGLIRGGFPNIGISGALITRFKQTDVSEDAEAYLRETAPFHIFRTVIRASDEKVAESTWAGVPTQMWSPWCSTSRDYRTWAVEFLQREGLTDGTV